MNTTAEQVILIHYGELILKGANRGFFERVLRQNVRRALADLTVPLRFSPDYGKLVILPREGSIWTADDVQTLVDRLQEVYGIATIWPAFECAPTKEAIMNRALSLVEQMHSNAPLTDFGVRLKRHHKGLAFTSGEVERELGSAIVERTGATVNLTDPALWVKARVSNSEAYVSVRTIKGAGGLPVGTGGKLLSLISSGIDSPVASSLMMRRGASVSYIHFHSYPLTTKASIENVEQIVNQLHAHQPGTAIYMAPLAEMQKQIAAQTPPKFRILLYRRAMVDIADMLARKNKMKGLITGESLGQVASQTIENMTVTAAGATRPLLRPLIGMDKEEIIGHARRVGTYDISIQPYEDCCSLLIPEQVETRADKDEIEAIIAELPWNEWCEQVLKEITIERIG